MSIKLLDPNATFKIVSLYDDAVDMGASNVQDYARTVDVSHLKFKEGKNPSYFIAKNLTPEDGIEIQDAHFKFLPGGKGADGKDLPPKVEVVDRAKMAYKYFKAAIKQIEHDQRTKTCRTYAETGVAHGISSFAVMRRSPKRTETRTGIDRSAPSVGEAETFQLGKCLEEMLR